MQNKPRDTALELLVRCFKKVGLNPPTRGRFTLLHFKVEIKFSKLVKSNQSKNFSICLESSCFALIRLTQLGECYETALMNSREAVVAV